MRKLFAGSLLLVLALASAGCNGRKPSGNNKEPDRDIGPDVKAVASPEAFVQASIQLLEALADVHAEIKDKDSAEKAEPKLDVLNRKAKFLAAISDDLHFDPEQLQQLKQKYKDDFDKAYRRLDDERRRINADLELAKLLTEIDRRSLSK